MSSAFFFPGGTLVVLLVLNATKENMTCRTLAGGSPKSCFLDLLGRVVQLSNWGFVKLIWWQLWLLKHEHQLGQTMMWHVFLTLIPLPIKTPNYKTLLDKIPPPPKQRTLRSLGKKQGGMFLGTRKCKKAAQPYPPNKKTLNTTQPPQDP